LAKSYFPPNKLLPWLLARATGQESFRLMAEFFAEVRVEANYEGILAGLRDLKNRAFPDPDAMGPNDRELFDRAMATVRDQERRAKERKKAKPRAKKKPKKMARKRR